MGDDWLGFLIAGLTPLCQIPLTRIPSFRLSLEIGKMSLWSCYLVVLYVLGRGSEVGWGGR